MACSKIGSYSSPYGLLFITIRGQNGHFCQAACSLNFVECKQTSPKAELAKALFILCRL